MKNRFCYVFFILLFLLTGCNRADVSGKYFPLKGLYTVTNRYNQNGEKISFKNNNVVFFDDHALITGKEYDSVNYMTKWVNLKDYLVNDYNLNNIYLDKKDDNVLVASIYSKGDYVCDVVIFDDTSILVNENNNLYEAKYDGKVDLAMYNNLLDKRKLEKDYESPELMKPTSLFLGIREDIGDKSNYYTVFSYKDSNNFEVYIADGIFLPKNNGFIKIDVGEDIVGGVYTNPISVKFFKRFEDLKDENISSLEKTKFYAKKTIKINYINSQFLSYTYKVYNYGRNNLKNSISIIPIESTGLKSPITLDQVFQKNAINIIAQDINSSLFNSLYYDNKNMGIIRRNGYWVLVARLFDDSGNAAKNIDISIRDINAKLLVNENSQSISIRDINKLFSNVEDFTTSLERNLAVVKTSKSFKIVNFKSSNLSIKDTIRLDIDNSNMFMNLWSYGTEAKVYRKFIKNTEIWRRLY